MRPARSAAVLVLLLTAACGTTVPVSQQVSAGSPLGGSTSDGGATTGLTGSSSSGASGTGPGGSSGSTTGLSGGTSGGGSQTGTTGSSATGGAAGGTSGATSGGTRVRTPLKVGVLVTDIGAAVEALGASHGSSHKADDGYRALINAYNLSGGMSGRKLVPTYEVVNALDNNYQADAERTCSTFKDAKVEIVFSDAASTDYGVAACLWQAHIPMLTSVPSDNTALAKAPQVFNAFAPTFDSGYGSVVDRLVASGYLTTKNKLGVIRITCAAITAAYQNTVLPRMRAAHLATPNEYTVPCASGFQDAGAYSAAMQNAVLKFRSVGVDRVFVLGAQENLLLQYFAEQAQNQDYHPGYALSSGSVPVTLIGASTFPQQQLPQVHGAGWHPLSDTGVDPKIPSERRCVAQGTKGGFKPANITETFAMYTACASVFLLDTVVAKGNGSAGFAALRATIPALGTSFSSTGIINGTTLFGPGRQNGPQLANEWAYNASCTCFRYVSKPGVMR